MLLYVELLAGKMLFRAPIAEDPNPNVVPRPTKHRTLQKKKGVGQGREVVVSWSLATLEMKGAETISEGSVFQSLTVLGKNELRR